METVLGNKQRDTHSSADHVLALSAAMPGLAGAIFRKNSLHAALRTTGSQTAQDPAPQTGQILTITLKLFNMIAAEKGAGILKKGGIFSGIGLSAFFEQRPALVNSIIKVEPEDSTMDTDAFCNLLRGGTAFHITFKQPPNTSQKK